MNNLYFSFLFCFVLFVFFFFFVLYYISDYLSKKKLRQAFLVAPVTFLKIYLFSDDFFFLSILINN